MCGLVSVAKNLTIIITSVVLEINEFQFLSKIGVILYNLENLTEVT